MSDNLRTRIAAVVHQYSVPIPMAELVAEAVIRELGLQREFSIGDEDGRVLWLDGEEPVEPREGEVVEKRYITEWTTDE